MLAHAGSFLCNLGRAALLGVSRGRLARRAATAGVPAPIARAHRRLVWAAARFALLTDLALAAFGPRLKAREALSGRFADALSWWLLGVAALRRFAAEGRREEDLPLVRWAVEQSLAEIQEALEGIARNFDPPALRWLGALVRGPGAFWLRLNPLGRPPFDATVRATAATIGRPGAQRERLIGGTFASRDPDDAVGRLEHALDLTERSRPIVERIARAARGGELGAPDGTRRPAEARLEEALAVGLIDRAEAELVAAAAAARRAAVEVDSFTLAEYLGRETAATAAAAGEPVAVGA